MKTILTILLLTLSTINVYCQSKVFSPFTVNQQIKNSVEENDRQTKLLANQTTNTGVQEQIKTKFSDLKQKLETLKGRFAKFSILIDVVNTSREAHNSYNTIKYYTEYSFNEVTDDLSLFNAINVEVLLMLDESESLIRYLIAAALSYQDILGMDNADRKTILNHIISELKRVERTSQNMYVAIKRSKMQRKLLAYRFQGYINKDVQLVKDIIANAKRL